MLIPGIVEVIAGLIIVLVALRGWQGRLARNPEVGVRLPSTMRSESAFKAGNRAAAPAAALGGILMALGGILTAVLPRHLIGISIFGGVGAFLICILVGAAMGSRAGRSAAP